MKSICIKTNDTHLLNYLLNEFDYIEIDKVCISTNQFKNYKNIIIHYTGNENSAFIHEVSCILSCFVIDEIEESILKRLILKNYFYFKDNDGYHAIIGITKNENLKEKIVDSYKITENIYMKRVNIDNSEFITLLDQYDNLIKDTDDNTTIFNAQKQVLSKYEELILQNG